MAPRRGTPSWCADLVRERRPGPALAPGAHAARLAFGTRCVHAGSHDDALTGAVGTPIYQASTFLLSPDQYAAIEDGHARDRFVYTRYGNPSQWSVQEKLSALEGAESCVVTSSGMAAIAATLFALLERGGHVVAAKDVYGGTHKLLQEELVNLGVGLTFAEGGDLGAIERAFTPSTQVLFFEAISNPLLKVADVPALAALARRHGARLVIDATFATPCGLRPLEHGADIVVHSCSKYLNGHSDLIAGAALGSRKLVDRIWARMLLHGGSLDPHACFLLERGLKTLALRMRAHEENALAVARFLEGHPRVSRVLHPLLPSHPDAALAGRLLRGAGGMVTFFVRGGDAAALRFVAALSLPKQATSLGGVESLVSLPFNTSHAGYTGAERARLGIAPGCVRLSVGIEEHADLIRDLDQALAASKE
jgi:cystathionine beta-lyase/cystathionine gamma-synthase